MILNTERSIHQELTVPMVKCWHFLTLHKIKVKLSTKFELDIIWVIIIWITILSTCKSINISFRTHSSSIVKHREFCLVLQLLRFSKLSMINMSVAKFLHERDICCLWKPTLFIQQSQDAWRIVLWRSFSKSESVTLHTVKIRHNQFSLKNLMQRMPVTTIMPNGLMKRHWSPYKFLL